MKHKIKNLFLGVLFNPLLAASALSAAEPVIIDPLDVQEVILDLEAERLVSVVCFRYQQTSDGYAYDILIEGAHPCEQARMDYVRTLSDKKEKRFFNKYKLGEKKEFSRSEKITVSLKDGNEFIFGPIVNYRSETFESREVESYEKKLENEKVKIDQLVKDASAVYFNQYGLCYRNVIGVNGVKVAAIRSKVECSSVDEESLVFVKEN